MFCLRAPLEVEVRRDIATLSRGERIRDLVKAHGVRPCGKGLRGGDDRGKTTERSGSAAK